MSEHFFITVIDHLLEEAKDEGLDHELILAHVYAKHLTSDEKCDKYHIYGVTFAEKFNKLMEEATNGG